VPVFGTSGNNASGRTVWANPAVQPGRRLCSQAQIIGQRWAPSWTPASLSPILWFDAATGITADAAGLVSQWNDRSATAAHAVQATGSSQPSSIAQSLNGYPVVTFGTGGIKTLVHSAQLAGTAYTAFYLLRATGESGVGATYYHAGSPSTGGLAFASELSVLGRVRRHEHPRLERGLGAQRLGNPRSQPGEAVQGRRGTDLRRHFHDHRRQHHDNRLARR
jgi:hypothetical protein